MKNKVKWIGSVKMRGGQDRELKILTSFEVYRAEDSDAHEICGYPLKGL